MPNITSAKRLATVFLTTIGSVLFATSFDAAACRVPGMNGVKNSVVDGTMSVQAGKECFIRQFTTTNDAVGARRFPATGLSIVSKPSRGSATVTGNRVVYKAPAGGPTTDQFTYQVVNRVSGKPGNQFTYRVNVSVY